MTSQPYGEMVKAQGPIDVPLAGAETRVRRDSRMWMGQSGCDGDPEKVNRNTEDRWQNETHPGRLQVVIKSASAIDSGRANLSIDVVILLAHGTLCRTDRSQAAQKLQHYCPRLSESATK
jgi:hypothetical protein